MIKVLILVLFLPQDYSLDPSLIFYPWERADTFPSPHPDPADIVFSEKARETEEVDRRAEIYDTFPLPSPDPVMDEFNVAAETESPLQVGRSSYIALFSAYVMEGICIFVEEYCSGYIKLENIKKFKQREEDNHRLESLIEQLRLKEIKEKFRPEYLMERVKEYLVFNESMQEFMSTHE